MKYVEENSRIWDKRAENNDRWSTVVTAEEVAKARNGDWHIILTPEKMWKGFGRMIKELIIQNWANVMVLLAFAVLLKTTVFLDKITILRLYALILGLFIFSQIVFAEFALADINEIKDYIQYPVTSNDVGLRKPNTKGLLFLSEKMNIPLSQMVMVGDEEKDIICANNAGVYSVLINRSEEYKDFGQMKSIHTMLELPEIVTEDKK